ncbi:uncharacterized protein LOC131658212 [Vicia villosa]|uniref:uncharacterized protein LOC131658212 n=1 Tax=Vicia villosa TaxID=3911 RepID=UPI00273CA899|nr:uncharacterized protein LOC131658212 [Vicia villosa]
MVVEKAPAAVDEVSPSDIDATTHASTKPSIHTDGAYPGGPTDRSVLTRYADHITFRMSDAEGRIPWLEVKEGVVHEEFSFTRGLHLRMSWLRDRYDKSSVYIDVCYTWLFSSLDTPNWDWGVAVFTMLYTTLGIASQPDFKQLTGYLSLLHYWIYEHLPRICDRRLHRVPASAPLARRWKGRKAVRGGVMDYRRKLDVLPVDDVIWTPYTMHCPHRPFDDAILYSWHMRWENHVVRHLPERCLRQFGFVQGIPRLCEDGYFEWYRSISYSRLIPPTAWSFDVLEPSSASVFDANVRVYVPPPPLPVGDQDSRLQLIVVL